jgi:hypothetical protein
MQEPSDFAPVEPPARRHGIYAGLDAPNVGVQPPAPMTKAALLDKAKAAVADRGLNYGKPEDNFERIAARWRVHLKNAYGIDVALTPTSVAIMMNDMKVARLENDPSHLDSWVDMAGYTACGAEIAVKIP